MPLLKINTDGPFLRSGTRQALRQALATLPQDAPVIICIHGYKFSPRDPQHDPHAHILSLDPQSPSRTALSWPRGLGFGAGDPSEGLCIALGWQARGSIWQAYQQARATGEALARLIWTCDRPVHLIGHSLGARVILTALPHLPEGMVSRAILLAAAEFRSTAAHALDTEAGSTAEVLNITSRENDLFDLLLELALSPDHGPSRPLGAGLGTGHRAWCDVQIDHDATRAMLLRCGYDIPAADKKVCHWSPYLREGMFDFYRSALRQPERLPLGLLQDQLPAAPTPRFSHLLPRPPRVSPLSFSRKASS